MTECITHRSADAAPHAFNGEPPEVAPAYIGLMKAQFHLNRAKHFASGELAEDHIKAAREMYEVADWARDWAETLEDSTKKAEG